MSSEITGKKEKNDYQCLLMSQMGGRLRDIRSALGLTQEELARDLDISKPAYVRYETGNRYPPAKILNALALKYNVDTNWLLAGKGAMFTVAPEDEALDRLPDSAIVTAQVKKRYLEMIRLMTDIPIFEQLFLAKLVEFKYMFRAEVEEHLKNREEE